MLNPQSGFFKGLDYEELTEQLNLLGSQGWEVVSAVNSTNSAGQTINLLVTLKRELPG